MSNELPKHWTHLLETLEVVDVKLVDIDDADFADDEVTLDSIPLFI